VLLESDLSLERRHDVLETTLALQQTPDEENYPTEEQPLCHYGHGSCHFHQNGCPSSWGMPGGAGPDYVEVECDEEYVTEGNRYE